MLLPGHSIANLLHTAHGDADPLVVAPRPDLDALRCQSGASVDLHLGTWFVAMKARGTALLDFYEEGDGRERDSAPSPSRFTNKYYIPFGEKFILHPRRFVLAVTLEWIRLPLRLAGMITGKSAWGRRGLIIETAPGIHPGFTGCLTLELTNVGEVPIAVKPGTSVCQLFLHKLEKSLTEVPMSRFLGQRQPLLSEIRLDSFARKLTR